MATLNGEKKMSAFSYDKEQDDLFIYNPNEKSSGSVEIGDINLATKTKKFDPVISIPNITEKSPALKI